MTFSEQVLKKFQQKFQEFSNTELDKIDKECRAKIQDLLAFQTEYFIECGNEMANEMIKEFENLIDEKIQDIEDKKRYEPSIRNERDFQIIILEELKKELRK